MYVFHPEDKPETILFKLTDMVEKCNTELGYIYRRIKKNSEKSRDTSDSSFSKNQNTSIKISSKIKYEHARIPQKIAEIQKKIEELNSEFEDGEDRNPSNLALINMEIANQQYELDKLEERWLELEYLITEN